MKATDNSGSRGLQVLSKGQLPSAEEFAYTQSNGSTGEVILEERLEADPTQVSECSVETLWLDGKMHWFNWVDRIFGRDLHLFPSLKGRYQVRDGIEVGHINPAHHAPAVKDAVFDAMEKAGQALGFHELRGGHLLKGDIFITKAGPVILELTPRCSGGWDSSATSPARGADLHGGLIQLALGAPLTLDLWHRHFNFRHGEQSAVILATVPDGAVDCIGRQYAMATGCEPLETLLNSAQHKLDKGDYLVPIL
jgi:biotin carboxylase